ncbi:MAG: PHP domain-containing protein [Clostridium sp.]|nr:PHP domain-containing protein [Clostridium sp.]
MKYADLHIHSSYSDGAYTPEEIIKISRENGVKCISITDHDSIGGQYVNAENFGDIEIISGIELSAEYNDMELHILGYYIDINNERLIKSVKLLNDKRLERVQKIINNLKEYDIELDIDELYKNNNETLGRSHIANAMVEKGYFSNYKQAFQSFLIKGKPGYEKGFRLSYREAIDIIKNAGGIAVLAHPGQIYKRMELEKIIKELKCFGLNGIEVYHPSHDKRDSNEFYNLAKKYKLTITGGSDFHGGSTYNENNIGNCGLDEIMLDKFKKNFK